MDRTNRARVDLKHHMNTPDSEDAGEHFRNARALLSAIASKFGACSSTYYLVKDPHTGREYYTTAVERPNGGIRFRDGKTQSTVMLQNSEIIEISKDQYRASAGAR